MSKRVLIIEDNQLNLKLFHDVLTASGFETIAATRGMYGLSLVKRHRPDLVVIDIQLPDISGLDVIRLIKGDKNLRGIPVLAVTAFQSRVDERWLLETGCDGFVPKPISVVGFINQVKNLLRPVKILDIADYRQSADGTAMRKPI
jgi:two-component system cell cycle response regulator DivK